MMDRLSKKINKDILSLNNTLDQMDLTNKTRNFHTKEAKYAFFSNSHETFSMIHYMIEHKPSLDIVKEIEMISRVFLDYNALKLETNLKEKK